jgi:hypothetical protein
VAFEGATANDLSVTLFPSTGFPVGYILAQDLRENLARADKFEADFTKTVDEFIAKNGLDAPQEVLRPSRLCRIAVLSEALGATHMVHTGGCSTRRCGATQPHLSWCIAKWNQVLAILSRESSAHVGTESKREPAVVVHLLLATRKDPYKESHTPGYTPLTKVDEGAIYGRVPRSAALTRCSSTPRMTRRSRCTRFLVRALYIQVLPTTSSNLGKGIAARTEASARLRLPSRL